MHHRLTFLPAAYEGSSFPILSNSDVSLFFVFFFNSHPSGCKVVSYCGFDLHLNCVEHLFMCFLTIWICSLEKCTFKYFVNLKNWAVCLSTVMSS